jgi:hypothetical protein
MEKQERDFMMNYRSILSTILNTLDKMEELSRDKQKLILSKKWESLYTMSQEQQEVIFFFNQAESDLKRITANPDYSTVKNNPDILLLKLRIKEKIFKYEEMESINRRLLKDFLYVAKQKVKEFFNQDEKETTYTSELDKKSQLWDQKPFVLDKFV